MIRQLTAAISIGLLLSACASSEPQRPDRERGERSGNGSQLAGASVASPLALALTGMASRPDGVVPIADIAAGAELQFAQFDADGSGGLSAIEHARWADAILGDAYGRPTMRMLDRDGSSAVSRDEFIDGMTMAARRLDKDGNGLIERSEMLIRIPEGRRQRRTDVGQGMQGGQRPSRMPR